MADAFGDAELGPQRAAHYVKQGFRAVKFDLVIPMSFAESVSWPYVELMGARR